MSDKKFLRKTTSKDVVDISADFAISLTENIEKASDLKNYVVAVGATFLTKRIAKIGEDVAKFVKSKKAKKPEECEDSYIKFIETLKFLKESQATDQDLLNALKDLHILSFAKDTKLEEMTEIYMLLNIVRKMSGPEILTIVAAYKISNGGYSPSEMDSILKLGSITTTSVQQWSKMVSRACGHSMNGFVLAQQDHLEELNLIEHRLHDGPNGTIVERFSDRHSHFRLTSLGQLLANLIVKSESIQKK